MRLSSQTITFIETVVELLDTKIGVGRFKFGIDPLFSFLPGIGGFIPTIFTAILVVTAVRVRAPLRVILLMTGYMGIDLLVSMVPVAGIPLDALFHANAKSWALLKPFVTDDKSIADKFKSDTVIIDGEVVR